MDPGKTKRLPASRRMDGPVETSPSRDIPDGRTQASLGRAHLDALSPHCFFKAHCSLRSKFTLGPLPEATLHVSDCWREGRCFSLSHTHLYLGLGRVVGGWGEGCRTQTGIEFSRFNTGVHICLTGCVEPVPPTAILGASCLPSLRIVTF